MNTKNDGEAKNHKPLHWERQPVLPEYLLTMIMAYVSGQENAISMWIWKPC